MQDRALSGGAQRLPAGRRCSIQQSSARWWHTAPHQTAHHKHGAAHTSGRNNLVHEEFGETERDQGMQTWRYAGTVQDTRPDCRGADIGADLTPGGDEQLSRGEMDKQRRKLAFFSNMRGSNDEGGQEQHPKYHIGFPLSVPPVWRISGSPEFVA